MPSTLSSLSSLTSLPHRIQASQTLKGDANKFYAGSNLFLKHKQNSFPCNSAFGRKPTNFNIGQINFRNLKESYKNKSVQNVFFQRNYIAESKISTFSLHFKSSPLQSRWKADFDPLKLLFITIAAATLFFQPFFDQSLASEEKEKKIYYTNVEEAREAGERRREEKERTQGQVITLPNGAKFRELEVGSGKVLKPGDVVYVYYTIYRLNGFYLDSIGYGNEGKNDVGETFKFIYKETKIPLAAEKGMEGMRVDGRRRILIPSDYGWTGPDVLPIPTTSSAERRFANAKNKALLFEVDVVKIADKERFRVVDSGEKNFD